MSEIFTSAEQTGEKSILVTITNSLGFHARPAARFVECASKYEDCEVFVEKGEERVNGKSIMGLMLFAAEKGSEMLLIGRGKDAEKCLNELAELFKTNFGEE